MSQAYPTPYYPDLQMLSAGLNVSGVVTVNTKFRQVTGIIPGLLAGSSAILAGTFTTASANKGQVTLALMNASTFVSSAYSFNVWTTGVM